MTAEWQQVAARFRTFGENLEPTTAERASAAALAGNVGQLLKRRLFRPRLDRAPGDGEIRIIGGHGKDTVIRPGVHADVVFVVPERIRVEASGSVRGKADGFQPLLQDMAALLAGRFARVEMSWEGWLAVKMGAAPQEPRAAVRVIPGFACVGGYLVPAPNGNPSREPWRFLNPRAELAHLDGIDATSGGKARHLIRMLKAWRRASGAAIGSFALELLACEFLSLWLYQRRSALFYDWMVRDFFFWLTAQAGRSLPIPGSFERLPLGDAWRPKAEAAYAAARAASDLERDNRLAASLAKWREIFGLAFPDAPTPTPQEALSSPAQRPTALAAE